MNQLFPSICLSAIALPCVLALAEPVELVYHFPKDEIVVYEVSEEIDQNQTIGGETLAVKSTTTQRIATQLLVQHRDGSFIIGNTIKGIVFSMVGAGMDIEYDSSKPEDESKLADPMLASMVGLNGIEIEFMLDSTGAILDVPNLPAIQNHIFELDDPSMMAMMEMMVQRETLIAGSEMHYKMLPPAAVDVNDQWKHTFEIPFELGMIIMELEFTLDAIDGEEGQQIAEISIDGQIRIEANEMSGVTVEFLGSTVDGSARFDIEKGLFESSVINNGYQIQIRVAGGGPDTKMQLQIDQKISINRIDD